MWWRVEPLPVLKPIAIKGPGRGRPAIPDLLSEGRVVGTRLKDDLNPFLQRTGWREAFEQRPFWHALRRATY
ncbi:hypothetical protein OR221_2658, partial [Microbacterium laevaniformans OR221]